MYFLIILAVVLFAGGIIYVNEHVVTTDAKVSYTVCLMLVVVALLLMAAVKNTPPVL